MDRRESSEENGSTPKRMRKNGTEQSCETCRKAKLKCDHATPCGRCARLKRECIYHPSPLSRTNGVQPRPPAPKPPQSVTNGQHSIPLPRRPSTINGLGNTVNNSTNETTVSLRALGSTIARRRRPVKYHPGFMGQTAHSAILNEHRAEINPGLGAELAHEPAPPQEEEMDATLRDQYGAAILARIPSQSVSYKAMQYYTDNTVTSSLHLRSLMMFHETFWATYGSYLQEPRKPAKLVEAARALSQNALSNPLNAVFTSSKEYQEALNNRWEMVGLLFSCYEHVLLMLPCTNSLLREMMPPDVDKGGFAVYLLEAAEACLRLLEELDAGLNLIIMFLSYRCSGMASVWASMNGDTSFQLWSRVGQLCSTATALGVHRIQEPDYLNQPRSILYVEQQKRLMAIAFMQDKHLSIFLGRPPSLSKRYVTTRPILDATEDALMEDDYLAITNSLNEFGYNKQGRIYRTTLVRALYYSSLVYEDILEISLGNAPIDILRVRSVRGECEQSFAHLPSIFHEQIDRAWFTRRSVWEITSVVEMQLIHMHQLFLLGRIELQQTTGADITSGAGNPVSEQMLAAAEQLLNIVLIFWTERDQYVEHIDDVLWAISSYGIPAASALAISLWKSTEAAVPLSRPLPTNRSQIIQNLSLFIACLDWVSPKDGNYMLCHRTKGLLKDILDRILSPSSANNVQLPAPVFSTWDSGDFSLAGMPNFGMDMDDLFSDEWLNAPRMNFN